jgi:hypothetical protein
VAGSTSLRRGLFGSTIDTQRHHQVRDMRFPFRLVSAALLFASLACDDDPPPAAGTPATTTVPPASTGLLRGAQLTEDARTVDVAVNGEIIHRGLTYPGVTSYVELPAGEYRVQFFPAGERSPAVAETTVGVTGRAAVTVAVVGLYEVRAVAFQDDRTQTSGRARVRLLNAVPDYPDPFDLKVVNGDYIQRGVGYLEDAGYAAVIPGIYDLEIHRSPHVEVIADEDGQGLYGNMVFTVFAVGTLRRDDVEIFLTLDAS